MALLSVFFGRGQPPRSVRARSQTESRNDLLSTAVRDTLRKHGIPVAWVGAETLPAKTPSETRAVHLRLVVRNTNPKLLSYLFALQRAIQVRVSQLDPRCADWLIGTSWRVDVPHGSDTTQLPGPAFWSADRAPERQPSPSAQRRELLSRTLAAHDRAFASTTCEAPPEFAPTQPMRG